MSRRPYVRPLPRASWYLRQGRYLRYIAREATCILIALYSGLLVYGLGCVAAGEASYRAFIDALQHPLAVAFHAVALAFAVYHTTSWFNVTPKAIRIQLGDDFVPGRLIVGAHYVGWVVVSLAVLWLVRS